MMWSDVFLFCFAIGTIWALAALLLGGIHVGHLGHIGHHHHGLKFGHHSAWGQLVNPSCLAIFLAWFGGVGFLLLRHSGFELWIDLAIAVAVGLAGALALARFLALLQKKERVLDPLDYDMIGTLGQVGSSIRPAGVGEILYVRDGARRAVPARSEDGVAIERGSEVIVTRYEKGIAYVRTWDAMTQ